MKIIKTKKKTLTNIYIENFFNIKKIIKNKKKILIIDYNIYLLLFSTLKKEFKKYKFIIIPYGENYKNLNTLKIIWKFLIKKK